MNFVLTILFTGRDYLIIPACAGAIFDRRENGNMEIVIARDYDEMSKISAGIIAAQIRKKHDSVLGLATGDTPFGTYKELVRIHREEGLDFSKIKSFNLDEYLGLAPLHPNSYNYFMQEHLFKHINTVPANEFVPQGNTDDPEEFCAWYERKIHEAGGIDLQVLGIGRNGHIAFNEPGSSLASRTRVKALAQKTIEDNSRFFESADQVPRFVITMGVGTILDARRILLVANGQKKADACAKFIEGPVTSQVTASALQLHPYVTVVLDEEAASALQRREYYNWIRDHKQLVQKRIGR